MHDGDSGAGPGGLPAREFALERFYARWEFVVPHNLSASDVEPVSLAELLALADPDTLRLWESLRLGYTESRGHPLLREEIARLYGRASAEDVLTFSGAEEGIFLALAALAGPGDHAVVVAPVYQSLYEVARGRGVDVSLVWLEADAGWRLDLDRVLEAIRPTTRLVVVNFPNNPTGALPEPAIFRRLHDECAARGIRLFSDEVYRGVEPDERLRLPAAADLGAGAISLGVMSKGYALPGIRVGWIVCRDPALLRRVAALKDYTTICGSAPAEVLAIMGLRAGDTLLDRAGEIVRTNLGLLTEFFGAHADRTEWIPPRAGTTAFPRLIGKDSDAFCDRLASEHGVLLLPGSMFDMPGEHVRVGLGRTGMEPGLALLGTALRSPDG